MSKFSSFVVLLSFLSVFFASPIYAGDSLNESMKIISSAIKLQNQRLKVVSENIANEDSTSSVSGGDPYKRKILIAKRHYDKKNKVHLLKVKKISFDKKTPFKLKYDPSHPASDSRGYVKYSNVNQEIELADIDELKRSQNANFTVAEVTNKMIRETIDMIK